MLNSIELFAGCGGLIDGFKESGKYNLLAAVEWEVAPCENLVRRLTDKWGMNTADQIVLRFDIQRTDILKRRSLLSSENTLIKHRYHQNGHEKRRKQ